MYEGYTLGVATWVQKKYYDHTLDLVDNYETSNKNFQARPHIRQREVQNEKKLMMRASPHQNGWRITSKVVIKGVVNPSKVE